MEIVPDLIFAAVMVIPFLVAFLAVKYVLVGPYLDYLEQRDAAMGGARRDADALQAAADEKLASLESQLKAARDDASGIRADHRAKAKAYEAEVVAAARKDAEGKVDVAVANIKAEAEAAKDAVGSMAHSIAGDIAAGALGRSIEA